MDYPESCHDLHNDYPLCPEPLIVTQEMLSPYTHALAETLGITPGLSQKLVPNLLRKEKYVVHYRNLKLYVQLGMKVTRIHRVISFKQSKWLKPYITLNTECRKNAKNEFEKNFYKLMNNSESM